MQALLIMIQEKFQISVSYQVLEKSSRSIGDIFQIHTSFKHFSGRKLPELKTSHSLNRYDNAS
jgi:hypothetical protein